jgi:hypothetical protein
MPGCSVLKWFSHPLFPPLLISKIVIFIFQVKACDANVAQQNEGVAYLALDMHFSSNFRSTCVCSVTFQGTHRSAPDIYSIDILIKLKSWSIHASSTMVFFALVLKYIKIIFQFLYSKNSHILIFFHGQPIIPWQRAGYHLILPICLTIARNSFSLNTLHMQQWHTHKHTLYSHTPMFSQ